MWLTDLVNVNRLALSALSQTLLICGRLVRAQSVYLSQQFSCSSWVESNVIAGLNCLTKLANAYLFCQTVIAHGGIPSSQS